MFIVGKRFFSKTLSKFNRKPIAPLCDVCFLYRLSRYGFHGQGWRLALGDSTEAPLGDNKYLCTNLYSETHSSSLKNLQKTKSTCDIKEIILLYYYILPK